MGTTLLSLRPCELPGGELRLGCRWARLRGDALSPRMCSQGDAALCALELLPSLLGMFPLELSSRDVRMSTEKMQGFVLFFF